MEQNIFSIVSAADKEMAHSAMVNHYVSRHLEAFLQYFVEERIRTRLEGVLRVNLKGHLEVGRSISLENGTRESMRLRFDIAFFPENYNDKELREKMPVIVIENKFKATPTLQQIMFYDNFLKESGSGGCLKILMVFMLEQVDARLKEYCDCPKKKDANGNVIPDVSENKWIIIPYLPSPFVDSNGQGNKGCSFLSFMEESISRSEGTKSDNDRWIFYQYRDYLLSYHKRLASMFSDEYFREYDISIRFEYSQYQLFIQKLIYDAIVGSCKEKEDEVPKMELERSDGSNRDPSVAFWHTNENKNTMGLLTSFFFSIDGMTPKIGFQYFKAQSKHVDTLKDAFLNNIYEEGLLGISPLKPKANTRKFKNEKSNGRNEWSVYSLYTFDICKVNGNLATREQVVSSCAKLVKDYFKIMSNWVPGK